MARNPRSHRAFGWLLVLAGSVLAAGCGSGTTSPDTAVPAVSEVASATGTTPPDTAVATVWDVASGTATATSALLTASPVPGAPSIGPLFPTGLGGEHSCTASVVDSPGHNLLLTAAHCIDGTGAGTVFVPGYDRGATPLGTFVVERAWADPAWLTGFDPQHDYAILLVRAADPGGRQVQDATGAHRLGSAPAPGLPVTVTGYLRGRGDAPISCTPAVELTGAYPGFRCDGFAGGTSGSPLIDAAGTVVGLIGGLHEGGCVDEVSYSPPFGPATQALLARAIRSAAGDPGDTLPGSGPGDC